MNEETQKKLMIEIFKKFSPEEQDIILKYHQMIAHTVIAGATVLKVLDEADLLDTPYKDGKKALNRIKSKL